MRDLRGFAATQVQSAINDGDWGNKDAIKAMATGNNYLAIAIATSLVTVLLCCADAGNECHAPYGVTHGSVIVVVSTLAPAS